MNSHAYIIIINFVLSIYVIQGFFPGTVLAGQHYNENAYCGRQLNKDGNPLLQVLYIKWQGGKPKVPKFITIILQAKLL